MRYIFKFPDIGEGLDEGKIIEWYVDKGHSIKSGDPLVKMETDKVVTDIPSPKTGIIAARYGSVGETIHVGNALVEIDIEGVSGVAAQAVAAEIPQPAMHTEVVEEKGFGVVGTMEVAGDGAYLPSSGEGLVSQPAAVIQTERKVLSTPVARAMAKEYGLNINQIPGTGPAGRVTKKDIEAYHQGKHYLTEKKPDRHSSADWNPAQPVQAIQSVHPVADPSSLLERVPLTTIRKTIAKNMLRSKQNAVHMSVMDEIEVSELKSLRDRYKASFEQKGIKLSYLPFVIKAITLALQQHPVLNAELDMEHEQIIYKHYYNIGVAVDTPDGLVVPVIRDADQKSITEIAMELNSFSIKAKERKLTLDDMKGGSFTITSYGSIGGYYAVPVINYPQVAILGIGRMIEKPVVRDHQIVVGNVLPISMSVDHRIVDGGEVARFLNAVLAYLKDPVTMFLG